MPDSLRSSLIVAGEKWMAEYEAEPARKQGQYCWMTGPMWVFVDCGVPSGIWKYLVPSVTECPTWIGYPSREDAIAALGCAVLREQMDWQSLARA